MAGRPKLVGLTGSIGMGKSATANLFREQGIPVFDADATVHGLYEKGGDAVAPIEATFPGVVVDGAVDRARLAAQLAEDEAGFEHLEAIVHPLVARERQAFLEAAEKAGAAFVVLDIPLLFETGGDAWVDIIIVAHAPEAVRRARVLQRPGMTEARLDAIIARQTADSDKLERADYVVETSGGIDDARQQVVRIIEALGGVNPDKS
ncbi:dephospho-CoA kinase [Maricaulis sp. CAU 1757]